jgi:hypothetical protein
VQRCPDVCASARDCLDPALDYFLELDTLQCTSTTTSNCKIDSGRFPAELKANTPSPLRMSPGAGLDFGNQPVGITTSPLTITLFNDPSDPNSQTINFTGNLMKGDYFETDNCGTSLAPGSSCSLNVTFKPKAVGFDQGGHHHHLHGWANLNYLFAWHGAVVHVSESSIHAGMNFIPTRLKEGF